MMGRQRRGQERLFYEFCLDEIVPADHVVRRIDAVLDTSWIHQELAPYYSTLGRLWFWRLLAHRPATGDHRHCRRHPDDPAGLAALTLNRIQRFDVRFRA